MANDQMKLNIEEIMGKLEDYIEKEKWQGYDPYDGLNSPLVKIFRTKSLRILLTQIMKRSPINFRPILGIKKDYNPKGMGLFASGYLLNYQRTHNKKYLERAKFFLDWLTENLSKGYSGICWGYNFDWQSRAFLLPKGTPTVVNTSFIGRAFLDAYEVFGSEEYLKIARRACDFILRDLNRLEDKTTICFSYSPRDNYFVNNATALASSLLGRVYAKTREGELAETAGKAINYVINHQREDGSWYYGEDKTALEVGIDNFHTGFILESLKIYAQTTGDRDCLGAVEKGLTFYQNSFFLDDGAPKYFHNRVYPLDIHCAAQAIVTLMQLKDSGADMELCRRVVSWIAHNMQDEKGYFYYQKGNFFTNKISYMRWSQAWAFYALSIYCVSYEQ